MNQVDFSYGSFNINFKEGNDIWHLAIHPEMVPAKSGIKPAGSYFVYCIHPSRGSVSFIIEQDDSCRWYYERQPVFFSDGFIEWVGQQIEDYGK